MSWSTEATGTKRGVRAAFITALTQSAATYAACGTPAAAREAEDILAAQERVLAAIDAAPDAPWPNAGLKVAASGSASDGYLSLQISVAQVTLALDPVEAPPAAPPPPETKPDVSKA